MIKSVRMAMLVFAPAMPAALLAQGVVESIIDGKCEVRAATGIQWSDMAASQALAVGDVVRCRDGARATLRIGSTRKIVESAASAPHAFEVPGTPKESAETRPHLD